MRPSYADETSTLYSLPPNAPIFAHHEIATRATQDIQSLKKILHDSSQPMITSLLIIN